MEFVKLKPYVRYARAHQNIVRPLEPAVCYDCRLFYFHKASGTFQWDQQTQKLVDGTVVYLPRSCKMHRSPGIVASSLGVISSRPSRWMFWL